jgi:hypothetical protein
MINFVVGPPTTVYFVKDYIIIDVQLMDAVKDLGVLNCQAKNV